MRKKTHHHPRIKNKSKKWKPHTHKKEKEKKVTGFRTTKSFSDTLTGACVAEMADGYVAKGRR